MVNADKMELVEDYLLENIGSFIGEVTGLSLFLIDQPWPDETVPSVGVHILSYDDSNGWGNTNKITPDGRYIAETDLTFTVELVARFGRPMATLALLIQAFRGFQELRYQHLYSKGIGILDVSNATPANTVFDGIETEKRARMLVTFCARISSLDTNAPNLVETITGSIYTNKDGDDTSPVIQDINVTFLTT